MSQGNVSGKCENGDEHGSGGPEVDTEGIKVLPTLQTLQLGSPGENEEERGRRRGRRMFVGKICFSD